MLHDKHVRSERRFEKHVDKAIIAHQKKLDQGIFSLPPDEGKLAIIASRGTTTNSMYSPDEQVKIFHDEAERVQYSEIAEQYDETEVYSAVNNLDIEFALGDREIAGMILIGHGTIAALRLHQDKFINWLEVSRSAKELKLGHFVQRMCGNYRISTSVPLGTFAVADQRNVIASLGAPIDDKYPDETLFQPVYNVPVNDATAMLELRDTYMPDHETPQS